jgi:hypothetical protein
MRRRSDPRVWLLPHGRSAISGLVAVLLFLAATARAGGVRDAELRRLFEPTKAELQEEGAGRIYNYDGLRDSDVERATQEEYERIENMMFIRENKTDAKGELLTDPATGEAVVEGRRLLSSDAARARYSAKGSFYWFCHFRLSVQLLRFGARSKSVVSQGKSKSRTSAASTPSKRITGWSSTASPSPGFNV